MAEVFVNLVDRRDAARSRASCTIFGRATSAIADSADWLATVDRFGIVSERVVLLDQFTAAQNIAMSLTLDIDPMAARRATSRSRRWEVQSDWMRNALDHARGTMSVPRRACGCAWARDRHGPVDAARGASGRGPDAEEIESVAADLARLARRAAGGRRAGGDADPGGRRRACWC